MSDWSKGYRSALRDLQYLLQQRDGCHTVLCYVADMTYCGAEGEWHFKKGYNPQTVLNEIASPSIAALLTDLERDAYVIAHEYDNKHAKKKHSAAREALPDIPLFPEARPRQLITRPTR